MTTTPPSRGGTEVPEKDSDFSAPLPDKTPGKRAILALLFVAGLCGSVFATWLQTKAFASRNGSGTYSLPSGNPVVSGTTITSTWANNTFSDVGTELTNSLDRTGKGGMSGALKLADGTVGAPAMSFVTETATGIYRSASHDIRGAVNGADVFRMAADMGLSVAGLGSSVNTSTSTNGRAGVYAVGGSASTGGDGLVGIGTGSTRSGVYGAGGAGGVGIAGTGGSSSGAGVTGTGGATNGVGVAGTGTGTGAGVTGTGGGTGAYGGSFTGGAGNGTGVTGNGAGVGLGGYFLNGTAATSSTRQDAVQLANGDLDLDGVANPNATVAIKNRLTPKNIMKAWIRMQAGASTATVNDSFNIAASPACSGNNITVVFSQAMGNGNYAAICSDSDGQPIVVNAFTSGSSSQFLVSAYNSSFTQINLCTGTAYAISCMVMGAQ